MKTSEIQSKYAINVFDRAKTPQEKKDRISFLKGNLANKAGIASNNQNVQAETRFKRQAERLDRLATKSGFKKYAVYVSGKFRYYATVNASNEADAERIAKNEVSHAAPGIQLSDIKTNKPIPA